MCVRSFVSILATWFTLVHSGNCHLIHSCRCGNLSSHRRARQTQFPIILPVDLGQDCQQTSSTTSVTRKVRLLLSLRRASDAFIRKSSEPKFGVRAMVTPPSQDIHSFECNRQHKVTSQWRTRYWRIIGELDAIWYRIVACQFQCDTHCVEHSVVNRVIV